IVVGQAIADGVAIGAGLYMGKSLPLRGPKKGSLTLRDKKGKVIQRRYYDSAGRAKKDMDYSDHGNPKHHPWGPHRHKWKWDGKKPKRGGAEPMNKGRR
ncbi:hypothetical protein KFV09_17485, partial [Anoxybacillus rupiensis]|nr:hypothetical protein [Anoxybacillus rupiensis]